MGERAMHEANRRHWNAAAAEWRAMRDRDQLWRRCPQEPELAFAGEALEMISAFVGDPRGKRACVVGCGDGYAAFALAGIGAEVTATDISERQLEIVAERAVELGLAMQCVRCDAADLAPLPDGADAVVVLEHTESVTEGQRQVVRVSDGPVSVGKHVLRRGALLRQGETVLCSGRQLSAVELGLLAEVGTSEVRVHPRPRVAVLATGNELVPAEQAPGAGQHA